MLIYHRLSAIIVILNFKEAEKMTKATYKEIPQLINYHQTFIGNSVTALYDGNVRLYLLTSSVDVENQTTPMF